MARIRSAVQRQRVLDTAFKLIEVPSRTGEAGTVSDRLAEILTGDGFSVQRPVAGHASAPAVLVRFDSGKAGKNLQFNGHLDTVHLPFVPPKVDGSRLLGSGASDMKGGIAAMVEALRAVRDAGALSAGSILITAHDLHEAPWGYGQQLDQMIRDGLHGDAVLIPEPLCDHLPVIGRGSATWKIHIRRPGPPVHEVMRPVHEPNVVAAGADLVTRLMRLAESLARRSVPVAGSESLFIGQIHSGEIYNQYPHECWLEGTRRWLPQADPARVEAEFRDLLARFQAEWRVDLDVQYSLIRNAFRLDLGHPLIEAFQSSYAELSGQPLPEGPKAFVDDGNSFWRLANVPAITHGPRAGGQHTVNEWVEIDDLVRVATLYALTAFRFCGQSDGRPSDRAG
ncbi:MAG TPA: M20/M25/M40 family metallo-hydrolase [Gemmataceae bacterium]|nr:M20/M25/M40 family metallo-hydrolase [Gemmataceae bacterium]